MVALQMAQAQPERITKMVLTSTSLGAGAVARLVVQGWLEAIDRDGLEADGQRCLGLSATVYCAA